MKKNFAIYNFSIAAIIIFSIATLSLFALVLVLGFQTRSLVDVFGGIFDYFESTEDIILTFVTPSALILGFSILVFFIIKNLKRLQ